MASRTVLIADSNARLAQLLGQLLADEPEFRVLEVCSSVGQALEGADRLHPDVVLVSERLQGQAGLDVCDRLRQQAPDATLMLWSVDRHRTRAEAGDTVDGVLERGMTFRELVRAVRKAQARRRAGNGAPPAPRSENRQEDAAAAEPYPPEEVPPVETDGRLLLGCDSCGVQLSLATDDMNAAVAQARTFFAAHDSCETSIDLTRVEGAPSTERPAAEG